MAWRRRRPRGRDGRVRPTPADGRARARPQRDGADYLAVAVPVDTAPVGPTLAMVQESRDLSRDLLEVPERSRFMSRAVG